jgi:hypothetical protein
MPGSHRGVPSDSGILVCDSQKLGYWNPKFWMNVKVKGKAFPWQVWTSPEGSRRLRLPDFKKISTWRWWGCQPPSPPPPLRKCFWYSFLLEAESSQGHSTAGRIMSMNFITRLLCVWLSIRGVCTSTRHMSSWRGQDDFTFTMPFKQIYQPT